MIDPKYRRPAATRIYDDALTVALPSVVSILEALPPNNS
jgi:hypothetical protein